MKKSPEFLAEEREHRVSLARQGLHMTAKALMQALSTSEEEMAEALCDLGDWFYGRELAKDADPNNAVGIPLIIMANGKDGA